MSNTSVLVTSVLVTGASGIAGVATCRLLLENGFSVRMADVGAPPPALRDGDFQRCDGDFQRCDTRTPDDCRRAVQRCDAVVHLAAWHCAHQPPVSDETIWAVNTDGTFNLLQACREASSKAVGYASSMAYG